MKLIKTVFPRSDHLKASAMLASATRWLYCLKIQSKYIHCFANSLETGYFLNKHN